MNIEEQINELLVDIDENRAVKKSVEDVTKSLLESLVPLINDTGNKLIPALVDFMAVAKREGLVTKDEEGNYIKL